MTVFFFDEGIHIDDVADPEKVGSGCRGQIDEDIGGHADEDRDQKETVEYIPFHAVSFVCQ